MNSVHKRPIKTGVYHITFVEEVDGIISAVSQRFCGGDPVLEGAETPAQKGTEIHEMIEEKLKAQHEQTQRNKREA